MLVASFLNKLPSVPSAAVVSFSSRTLDILIRFLWLIHGFRFQGNRANLTRKISAASWTFCEIHGVKSTSFRIVSLVDPSWHAKKNGSETGPRWSKMNYGVWNFIKQKRLQTTFTFVHIFRNNLIIWREYGTEIALLPFFWTIGKWTFGNFYRTCKFQFCGICNTHVTLYFVI